MADKVDSQVELGRGNHIIKGIWEAAWEDSRPTVVSALNNTTIEDAQNKPDMIMGMLNILAHLAIILIDLGATHSVISHLFAQKTQLCSTFIGYNLGIAIPRCEVCYVQWEYQGCMKWCQLILFFFLVQRYILY